MKRRSFFGGLAAAVGGVMGFAPKADAAPPVVWRAWRAWRRVGGRLVESLYLPDGLMQTAYPLDCDMRVAWFHPSVPSGRESPCQCLPADVFDRLVGYDNRGANPSKVKWYADRPTANEALARAVVG